MNEFLEGRYVVFGGRRLEGRQRIVMRSVTGALALLGVVAVAGTLAVSPAAAEEGPNSARAAEVAADSSTRLTDADKFAAVDALGIIAPPTVPLLNDSAFVHFLWKKAKADSQVKAAALAAYMSDDVDAAYVFVKTGVFEALRRDQLAEIAAEQAKAARRAAAVDLGLDPADTAMIELDDERFIIRAWQRLPDGSFRWLAARAAFREGSTQADWTAFITTGAKVAAKQDLDKQLRDADEALRAKLLAEALRAAKSALLNLMQMPASEEKLKAPNREFVLGVWKTIDVDTARKDADKQVWLGAQDVLMTPGAELEQALHEFIVNGARAAHELDVKAVYDKLFAAAKSKVELLLDAARRDGFQPSLVAGAEAALKAPNLAVLNRFLTVGADEARRADLPAPAQYMTIALKGALSARCANVGGSIGSTAEKPGQRVELSDCTASRSTQRWMLRKADETSYNLVNILSQHCLGVAGGGTGTSDPVVQGTCTASAIDQRWKFEVLDSGLFRLRNVKSSLMLAHAPQSVGFGTPLSQVAMAGDEATQQQWRLIDLNRNMVNLAQSGKIELAGVPSGRCLQVLDSVPADVMKTGTQLALKDCRGQALAQWTLIDLGQRRYSLKNQHTGLCMDLWGRNAHDSGRVAQYTCINEANQMWVFQAGPSGAVRLLSALTGTAVSATGTANNALLVGNGDRNTPEQHWKLTVKDG